MKKAILMILLFCLLSSIGWSQQLEYGMTEKEVISILGQPIKRTETSEIHGLLFRMNRTESWLVYFKYQRGQGSYYPYNAYDWRLIDWMISK